MATEALYVRIKPQTDKALRKAARETKLPLNALVELALSEWLAKRS